MARLVQFTGDRPEWIPGFGYVAPGQHLDVNDETVEALNRRPDFVEPGPPDDPGHDPGPPDVPGGRP